MRDGEVFRHTTRRGIKGVQPDLVVHVDQPREPTDVTSVGFVVSKQVGNAVTRNAVKRKLRHLSAMRLERFPAGSHVVMRALPGSAERGSAELGAQIDAALERIARRRS